MYPQLEGVGKNPVKFSSSKSLVSRSVMKIFLVLVVGAGVGWDNTGRLGARLTVCNCVHVDQMFLRASFIWHLAVARLLGICFEIKSAVKPGKEENARC